MPDNDDVHVWATRYEVSSLPPDYREGYYWTLSVAYRGQGLWAVANFAGENLGRDGEWDYEPLPSSRTDEWLAAHRFTMEQALTLAKQQAPVFRGPHGWTFTEAVAWREEQDRLTGEKET